MNNLVLALYRGGERDLARQFLSKAQIAGRRVSFSTRRPATCATSRGPRRGARRFQEAISSTPTRRALNNTGALLLENPPDVDPLPYLMRAIEKDPENVLFRDTLGWYYFKEGDVRRGDH
jgi:hypothetical protein